MMKTILFYTLFLMFSVSLYSQDQPKLGTIVFESCKYIANTHLAPTASEIEQESERLKMFVAKNSDSNNFNTSENSIPKTEIQTYGDSLKCFYTLDIYKGVYESKMSCAYLEKPDDEMYKQIDRKTLKANTVKRNVNTNSYTILPKQQIKLLSISDTYEISEYRNERKVILGYNCFKIVLKKKNPRNPHLDIYNIEMYVTEDIKLNYSPITRFKDVLEKYYPLQITKKPKKEQMIEVITWKAKQINL